MLQNIRIEQKLTPYNVTKKGDTSRIKWIVIHYFGILASADEISDSFASAYRGASAHYAVDEGPIVYQNVLDGDISWHCGTTGTYYHPTCRNSNSIGIEVRPRKLSAVTRKATDPDWYFEKATIDHLVELTKYLMEKYNVSADNVIRHYDVTHKWCPRPFVGTDKNSYYGTTGETQWELFKKRLTEKEEEEMTQEQFESMYSTMMSKKKGDNPKPVFAASCEKAKDAGVFNGDGKGNYNWQDPVSREALAAILDRTGLLDK